MWRAYLRLPQLFGACRVVLLAWLRQLQHRGIAARLYGIAFLGFAAMLVLASLAVFCVQGDQLQDTIFSISFAALSLAGPLSLLVVHGVVMRINAITDGMRRIALNETFIAVPSVGDSDEIGEMARALEVFKNNATTLAGNAKEIEKLNHWFDIALNSMARGLSMFDADRPPDRVQPALSRYVQPACWALRSGHKPVGNRRALARGERRAKRRFLGHRPMVR